MLNNFKYNIGDVVVRKYPCDDDIYGKHLEIGGAYEIEDYRLNAAGKAECLIRGRYWWPEDELATLNEIDDLKAAGTTVVDVEVAAAARMAKEEADKKRKLSTALKTVNIKGVDVLVIEHFKDIKTYCENYKLFSRWYNRSQFLKAIIGTYGDASVWDVLNGNVDISGSFGDMLGYISGTRAHDCWSIEIYDTDNMTQEQIEWAVSETGDFMPGFFLDGKEGKIYFVFTDVD